MENYTVIFFFNVNFQVKERTKYRSRNGFSQSDGIAQYSANFYRSRKPRKIEDYHRPPSYEPYRPQRPKTIFAGHSDDESYLNNHRTISSSSSTTHFPELKIGPNGSTNPKPPSYPTSKKSLVPILKAERKVPTLEKKFPWEVPKYQNQPLFNGCESDEELIKPLGSMAATGIDPFYRNGSVSPKFTSHHALCTNQVSFKTETKNSNWEQIFLENHFDVNWFHELIDVFDLSWCQDYVTVLNE